MLQGIPEIQDDKDIDRKKWPWWLAWIRPHHGSVSDDYIVRCSCGRVMWLHSSEKIKKHHMGCRHEIIVNGSMWDFFKMKTGLLRCRTITECFKDIMGGKS